MAAYIANLMSDHGANCGHRSSQWSI